MSADETTIEPGANVGLDVVAGPGVEAYLGHLEHGRADPAIDGALEEIRRGRTVTEVVEHLLAPAQRLVGQRWQQGRYSVAQEHFASGVTEDILGLLATHTEPAVTQNTVALVCAEGEWHTTPARMAALRLRDAGWRVQFLGGSMPAEHLAASLRQMPPQAVAISCTLPLALDGVRALVEAARQQELPVLAGGIGFGPDDRRARRFGIQGYASDPTAAAQILTNWLDQPPGAVDPEVDPQSEQERVVLAERRAELAEATYAALARRVPTMANFDERQRQHTRRDLDYILRFAETALLVDDDAVFTDFTVWLDEVLVARGVPAGAVDLALVSLSEQLPDELPRTRTVLDRGRDRISRDALTRPAG